MPKHVIATFYRFSHLDDLERRRADLLALMDESGIRGTILLASEGINGTVAGSPAAVDGLLRHLRSDPRLSGLKHKESTSIDPPFKRTKVRIKKEIVSLGKAGIDPTTSVGQYVSPADWNALISDPGVTLIDTRNTYEYRIGSFEGAIDPETISFRDFPQYVDEHLDPKVHRKVAMFCTGGIRCEKATSYLLSKGFEEVYHLEGGILKYLEQIPTDESLWKGECFVFDDRVSVDHNLNPGHYDLCHACRMPLSAEDMRSDWYIEGASCLYCHEDRTDEDRVRYLERERQIRLAEERDRIHLGPEAQPTER